MKIFRKGGEIGQVGDCLEINIEYMDSSMQVRAQVVHNEKIGFRKRLYGFTFVDLTDEQKSRLTALARIASDTLTIAHR